MASKTGIAASNDVNSSSDVGRDCGSNSERLKCVSDIFWGAARGEYIITSPNQCKFYDSVALKCAYTHTYTCLYRYTHIQSIQLRMLTCSRGVPSFLFALLLQTFNYPIKRVCVCAASAAETVLVSFLLLLFIHSLCIHTCSLNADERIS